MQLTNDKTIKEFLSNLQIEGKSAVSIKNYKSDIGHFLAWAMLKLKTFGTFAENVTEIIPFINSHFFAEYKNYMAENNIKNKTINRRLSTLRNFSHFLTSSGLIDTDFMQGIQNVGIGVASRMQGISTDIVDRFKESLTKSEKVSANTIKNYVSDVKSFLDWMEKKGNLPNGI